jgi:phosphatidylserine/phosphatidylglycerophosphate/cardiolipin synthase-like enzyme
MIDVVVGKEFADEVVPIIGRAQQSIRIVVFDWRWYPNEPGSPVQKFNLAILAAKKRGVDVKVVSNCDDVCKVLKGQGIDARHPITPKLVHAKFMVIDGRISVIGSHNYTQNAFTMNHEVSCIIDDKEVATRLSDVFNGLYAQ